MQATHHQQHQHQSVFIQPTSPSQPPPVIAFQLTQPIDSAWQSSQTPAPAIHPALATPPVVLAGGKRKLSDDFSSSNPRTSALDALRKRQRRFRSASSLSDSDDDKDAFDSPRTPAVDDEAMEWAPESTSSSSTALTAAGLGPNQVCIAHFILSLAESLDISLQPASSPHLLSFPPPSSLSSADDLDDLFALVRHQSLPPWRAPSPSESIHRLELLREARAPVVTTYTSSFSQSPFSRDLPPSKAVPMVLHTRDDEYVFTVELPGYNIDVRLDSSPAIQTPPPWKVAYPLVFLGHHGVMQARKCGNSRCGHMASASRM